jgi:LacI family repressor for deo operon, udp, cdd, tsx, nupC, and nupG
MADIHDVARRARVHISTVSRVLSHPEVVAPATRNRVLKAIAVLNYSPNPAAIHLRTRRSKKLLVITPDLSNAIFPAVLGGIEAAANRAGYTVLLGYTAWGEPEREERYVRMMANHEADGLVFLSPEIPRAALYLTTHPTASPRPPVVNVLSCDTAAGIPSVHVDNYKAAYQAMDYLYSLGHRHIALVNGPRGTTIAHDRFQGALARARESGHRSLRAVNGELSFEGGRLAAEQLLTESPRPTAIFCTKDEMAIGVMDSARLHGLHVPRDLSVMGFDDVPLAQYTTPTLTSVTQPMCDLGQAAVKLVIDILAGADSVPASVVLPHQISVRASTGAPRRGPKT